VLVPWISLASGTGRGAAGEAWCRDGTSGPDFVGNYVRLKLGELAAVPEREDVLARIARRKGTRISAQEIVAVRRRAPVMVVDDPVRPDERGEAIRDLPG